MKVVAPAAPLKLETVSSRLKRSLQHPNRDGTIVGIRYSPDGKKIVAGDYPAGVVVLWDAESGKQLTKIESGRPTGYEYFWLTPDWTTIFAPFDRRKHSWFERDGKKQIRWEMDGGVRSWDLATGLMRETYRHDPPRSVIAMWLSPDGRRFATYEELSGEAKGSPKRASTLWDVATKTNRPLTDGLYMGINGFSPDSNLLFGTRSDADGTATAIELVDPSTAKIVRTIPVSSLVISLAPFGFSPDGQTLIARQRVFSKKSDPSTMVETLKLWDRGSGAEVMSLIADDAKSYFGYPRFSPDSRTVAVGTFRATQPKILLLDVPQRQQVKTIPLPEKSTVQMPAFSPDGRWLAVISQVIPDELGSAPWSDQAPQPRVHIIDVATWEVRETLVLPRSYCVSACFSPDGKTLATSGRGKVLLWDLAGLK